MSGRLTLTWANKEKALLSHGETGYEWVDKDDPRAREVRLLDEVGRVGEVTGDASDNLLIRGDSLDALRSLVHSPQYAAEYRGKVKLIYIDPPFNTGQAFEHYEDSLEHSVWLGMMRERLVLIRELLAQDGSVWVHLDDAEMAYCRVLMDEVFGRSNFKATVIWQKTTSARNDNSGFSRDHDFVMVYGNPGFSLNGLSRSDASEAAYKNPDDDPRGPWREGDYKMDKGYMYEIAHPRTGEPVLPPAGKEWRYPLATHLEHVATGAIWWGKTLNYSMPKAKRFRTAVGDSVVPQTMWLADDVDTTRRAKTEIKNMFPGVPPFDTPKPEKFLERVIHIGSNPGDVVLDCFAGSGTTAAVAHKMGRRWVTAELSENTADTFTKPRLEKVVNGGDPGGITRSAGWEGGGGFRDLRVAASVWQVISDEHGTVALQAEGVDHATLSRAVAAQLGYRSVSDRLWAGTKGRSRLAVIEGVVDEVAVADIVSALGEGETALIAALAATHDAETTLKELSRGSRILRLPIDLFPNLGKVTR